MAHLRLRGLSEDGTVLVLTDEHGGEHRLDVTPALRTAVGRTGAGPGAARRKEKSMESALRPRDIQARIRAGESTETVAAAARTSVEAIMAFAGPVLAERAHVAERAQRSTLRRRGADAGDAPAGPGGARLLGDAVEAHLRSANVDPTTVEWDAWRREDGRWSLVAGYATGARAGLAEFTFDAPGNYVLLDNEDARWLVGDPVPEGPVAPSAHSAPAASAQETAAPGSGVRRLAAVPPHGTDDARTPDDPDQLTLGDDALDLVAEPEPGPEPTEEPAAEASDGTSGDTSSDTSSDTPDEPPARRPVQKKKGRASVPSWDEIMFGGGDQ